MKFSVSRDQFLNQLGIAVRGVSTRSAIQTLAGVLIRAEAGSVELQATDMELGIRVRVEAAPEKDGAVLLCHNHLAKFPRATDPVLAGLRDELVRMLGPARREGSLA